MERFTDLGLDAPTPLLVGRFWADALGQELEVLEDGDVRLVGPNLPVLWIDRVPEPKVVKNRLHLDLYVPDVDALVDFGATLLAEHEDWSVLGDPEGNECCALPRGCAAGRAGSGVRPLRRQRRPGPAGCVVAGPPRRRDRPRLRRPAPLAPRRTRPRQLILKFVPVDDERVAKNRMHWDVTTDDVDGLVAAGATVVREPDDDIQWTVMQDPQGNVFCAFTA